jgi:hypothetical protein
LVDDFALDIEPHNTGAGWELVIMRVRDILYATSIPSAMALHQRVVAHSSSTIDVIAPSVGMIKLLCGRLNRHHSEQVANKNTDISNYTETITTAPQPPLKTVVQDKHAVGASIMGLIVFSAAGLVLL